MMRACFILAFTLFLSPIFAQETEPKKDSVAADTVKFPSDSIRVKKGGKVITIESYAKRFNPRKAILYSAVLPGMGQVYNKKYWKVPLVYGGFGFITYYVIKYNELYTKYKDELFDLVENPGSTTSASGYTEAQLRNITDTARRQRDFFVILDGMFYILQLVDAHVDAHLKEFDLNPQLKVSLTPSVQQNGLTGKTSGFSITLKF